MHPGARHTTNIFVARDGDLCHEVRNQFKAVKIEIYVHHSLVTFRRFYVCRRQKVRRFRQNRTVYYRGKKRNGSHLLSVVERSKTKSSV